MTAALAFSFLLLLARLYDFFWPYSYHCAHGDFFQYACNVQYACNNTDIDYDYVTQHHKLHDCMFICEVYFNILCQG